VVTFAVALPFSGRYVPPEWAIGLASLQFPTGCAFVYLNIKGAVREKARIALVKEAQRLGVKYLLFLDDDTMPPPDTVRKLHMALETADDDVVACGGVYTNKKIPSEPLIYREENSGPCWKWKVGDVFPVWGIGTGCLMIKVSVFEHLPEPWFRDITSLADIGDDPSITVPEGTQAFYITDDIYFCRKVAAAGFKILAHGGVLPVHWDQEGKAFTLPSNSYPLQGITTEPWYSAFGVQPENVV
jgi:hypothetical protein